MQQLTCKTPRLLHKPEIAEFEDRWKGLDSVAAKQNLVRECKAKRRLIDDVRAHSTDQNFAR